MRTAEKELSNKIIKLVNERDDLTRRKVPQSGIVSKMRNWILGIRVRLKDSAVNSNNKYHTQGKHLEKVVGEYMKTANTTVTPYLGWYSFQIPKIDPNVASMELLSV